MSQEQQELNGKPQESVTETNVEAQVVPVSEAIRYRKRAQAAEQQVEQLTTQLAELEQEHRAVKGQVDQMKQETALTQQLTQAGVKDLEAALLLAQRRLYDGNGEKQDIPRVIEQLRKERPYLFGATEDVDVSLTRPTTGVRTHSQTGVQTLSRLAERARTTGSRKDMQEYMRIRRSVRG
jgi:uncharacterized protein YhaN